MSKRKLDNYFGSSSDAYRYGQRYQSLGDDSNPNTMGGSGPLRPTFRVPYTVRELKHKQHQRGLAALATNQNTLTLQTINHIVPWDAIGQGTGVNDRVGNSIFVRRVNVRGKMTGPVDAATTFTDEVRIFAILDMDGHVPTSVTFANLFNDPANDIITAFLKPELASQFKVLYDKTFALGGYNTTSNLLPDNWKNLFHFDLPINQVVTWTNNTPDKQLYIIAVSGRRWNGIGTGAEVGFTSQALFTDT